MRYGIRFEKIPPAQTLAEEDLAGRTFRNEALFTARRFDDGLANIKKAPRLREPLHHAI